MPALGIVDSLRDGVLDSFVIPAKLVPAKAGSRDPGLEPQHFRFPLALDPGFRRGDDIPLQFTPPSSADLGPLSRRIHSPVRVAHALRQSPRRE
jgi:hypothetical protein